jgi:hypothetical protein
VGRVLEAAALTRAVAATCGELRPFMTPSTSSLGGACGQGHGKVNHPGLMEALS